MLKKAILQTQFGSPHLWTAFFINNLRLLQDDGWELYIFSPNYNDSVLDNIHFVSMNLATFDSLVFKHCGVKPENFLDPKTGNPHKLVSDYYPAYGQIFQDHFKADLWGHVNWDVVFGDMSNFYPDKLIEQYDIYADEMGEINGVFTVYQNNDWVNNLFREVPDWQTMFTEHQLFYFDETHFTKAVLANPKIKFGYPKPYPFFSYDRFPHQVPKPLLERRGKKLYELAEDIVTHRKIGKEISFYHFSYTKEYPDVPAF